MYKQYICCVVFKSEAGNSRSTFKIIWTKLKLQIIFYEIPRLEGLLKSFKKFLRIWLPIERNSIVFRFRNIKQLWKKFFVPTTPLYKRWGTICSAGFFVQSILAVRYIVEFWLVPLERPSTVEFEIKKSFKLFLLEELSKYKFAVNIRLFTLQFSIFWKKILVNFGTFFNFMYIYIYLSLCVLVTLKWYLGNFLLSSWFFEKRQV